MEIYEGDDNINGRIVAHDDQGPLLSQARESQRYGCLLPDSFKHDVHTPASCELTYAIHGIASLPEVLPLLLSYFFTTAFILEPKKSYPT
jgi:hypothetical protein